MTSRVNQTVANIPMSVTQAINFMTRTLTLTYPASKVITAQLTLLDILSAALKHSRLTLSFYPGCLPPRPIYAACVASGIQWADWSKAIGCGVFDIIIEQTRSYVRAAGQNLYIWHGEDAVKPTPAEPVSSQRHDNNDRNKSYFSLRAGLTNALTRARTRRTLAQQLLESSHEEQEADEIFALISDTTSKMTIASPTPTRGEFHIALPTSTASSPESSRPSSRSSVLSRFSFAASEDSMLSSTTSVASSILKKASVLAVSAATRTRPPTSAEEAIPARRAAKVFVDNSKKEVQRYTYHGGVSTVLTGGVMLGGACKAPSAAPALKKRVQKEKSLAGADNKVTWRRAARV